MPCESIDAPAVVLNLGTFYLKQQISQDFGSRTLARGNCRDGGSEIYPL